MKLTETQIEFIIDKFFDAEKPGFHMIADILVRDGSCIIAGNDQLWWGGIGNFIQALPAKGAVGCLELTFMRKAFLSSLYFLERKEMQLKHLNASMIELQNAIDELKNFEL